MGGAAGASRRAPATSGSTHPRIRLGHTDRRHHFGPRRAVARRRAEREELEQALARFCGEIPIRLADLGTLLEGDFRHLLAWIGRAFETGRDAHGARHAWSADGGARITLHAPTAERITIATPLGRFESPNYALEVDRS